MIDLNDDTIKAILDTAERFAQRELFEEAHEHDKYPCANFANDAFQKAWEAGLVFITAPEDLGGIDLPAGIWAPVLEKVALFDSGFAASLLAHAMAAEAMLKWGKDELKAEWIGTDSLKLLGYPAYLQADDPQGLPVAKKDGDGYLLTGVARLVANAPVADAAVVPADMDDDICLFLVPGSEESRPEPVDMLGLRSCPVGHLDLEDLKVAEGHLLVKGREAVEHLHSLFLPSVTAILIAAHKASLDYAIEYGMERFQGGRMIHEHSQLRSMYGMMAAENITLRQAWLRIISENGLDKGAAMALKIMAADLAIRGVMDGVQLLGGYGYTMEYPQERRMRDARQAAELLGSPIRQKLAIIDEMIGGDSK
jgi:alkylation response protein AidB-like acyl-CoA dehydrogenase